MTERKMATIRKIDAVDPIPGADAIEVATVGGWKVVIKKNEFSAGDLAVYCEIDSWMPTELAPFLSKGAEPSVYEGIRGERLRTVRLRKQISQGLLLPVFNDTTGTYLMITDDIPGEYSVTVAEGDDVSELLNVIKYDAPMSAQLAGEARGLFPSFIPKTDQERVQNLKKEIDEWREEGLTFEETEKLDGSSMTVYLREGEFGVCSRNLDLKPSEFNSFWKMAVKLNLEELLRDNGGNYAVQGELIGEGIQGNPYSLKGQMFYVYDIYDITAGKYLIPAERKAFVDGWKLAHCPVLKSAATIGTVEELIAGAEGQSVMGLIGCLREGMVYKCNERDVSFKAISNSFLMKHGG